MNNNYSLSEVIHECLPEANIPSVMDCLHRRPKIMKELRKYKIGRCYSIPAPKLGEMGRFITKIYNSRKQIRKQPLPEETLYPENMKKHEAIGYLRTKKNIKDILREDIEGSEFEEKAGDTGYFLKIELDNAVKKGLFELVDASDIKNKLFKENNLLLSRALQEGVLGRIIYKENKPYFYEFRVEQTERWLKQLQFETILKA